METLKAIGLLSLYAVHVHIWNIVYFQDQYTLIYTALLEHIACGDTSIAAPTKSVQDKVTKVSSVDPYTKKTVFEMQFEVE